MHPFHPLPAQPQHLIPSFSFLELGAQPKPMLIPLALAIDLPAHTAVKLAVTAQFPDGARSSLHENTSMQRVPSGPLSNQKKGLIEPLSASQSNVWRRKPPSPPVHQQNDIASSH